MRAYVLGFIIGELCMCLGRLLGPAGDKAGLLGWGGGAMVSACVRMCVCVRVYRRAMYVFGSVARTRGKQKPGCWGTMLVGELLP